MAVEKKQNPYSVIAKVRKTNGEIDFVKYTYVDNLRACWLFLKANNSDVFYINVFSRANGNQLANFTKNSPPQNKRL